CINACKVNEAINGLDINIPQQTNEMRAMSKDEAKSYVCIAYISKGTAGVLIDGIKPGRRTYKTYMPT
ncbi:18064_t:CDS:2, partial [Racocetra persica]